MKERDSERQRAESIERGRERERVERENRHREIERGSGIYACSREL